jgi:hypothetical protein
MDEIYESFKAIQLSDDYLDAFSSRPQNCVTLYYEDFLIDPVESCRRFITEFELPFSANDFLLSPVKLVQTAQEEKVKLESQFKSYFLESYHYIPNQSIKK